LRVILNNHIWKNNLIKSYHKAKTKAILDNDDI